MSERRSLPVPLAKPLECVEPMLIVRQPIGQGRHLTQPVNDSLAWAHHALAAATPDGRAVERSIVPRGRSMTAVEVRAGRFLIDGVPQIVLAGEIHYFRVPRGEWEDRLDLAVEAGCNAIASYIPWLLHELPDGAIDVAGETRPDRDVGAFIDACAAKGLWFIARPGPFVMAELMNEGIPFRVYREHPELIGAGWDGILAPSRTLDYLQPAFLAETRRWYAHVMPVIAERLAPRGGNVIVVQLDNEIGMLAWVTNSPDFTPHLLEDFRGWIGEDPDRAAAYGAVLNDELGWAGAVRSPQEEIAGQLRLDLTLFMRNRFARYVVELRAMAEQYGVAGVPYLINLHGTAAGSAEPFPLGISQLVDSYAAVPGMISGSDHYVGEMTLNSTTDLYVMNLFQEAVHGTDQVLTSAEFEVGSGDYGGGMDSQFDPATVELKTRLFLAQGARLINYYLLAGGVNRPLDAAIGNGIDRIAFTGERHGTAAPIGPEGQRSPTFAATARTGQVVHTMARWLGGMRSEPDNLQLGLVLDAYATEYRHPGSAVMGTISGDLIAHRGAGPRRALARSALVLGYQLDAVWLERDAPRPDAVLMVSTGQYLGAGVQQRLVDFVEGGGRLLLLGRLPTADLAGRACSVLADACGLRSLDLDVDRNHRYPTVLAQGWAAPSPATRVGWLERLDPGDATVVLTDNDQVPCGVELSLGAGRVVHLAAELPSSRDVFGRALNRLGAHPRLSLDAPVAGVFGITTVDDTGQRLLHLINITGHAPEVRVAWDGGPPRTLHLLPRTGVMLPLGLITPHGLIESADAEVIGLDGGVLRFGPGLAGEDSQVRFRGAEPAVDSGRVLADGDAWIVRGSGPLTLRFG